MTHSSKFLIKSELSISLLNEISTSKGILIRLSKENRILKKLCFFHGDIHQAAIKKIQENAVSFNDELNFMNLNKNKFKVSHNCDYLREHDPDNAYLKTDNKPVYKTKPTLNPLSPKRMLILKVMEEADTNDIALGDDVYRAINAELGFKY